MFLSDLSIRRPLFAIMINLAIVLFGFLSYSKISVDREPKINFPYVFIFAAWPGASPTTVEQQLLKPMEDILKTTESLERLEGTAAFGAATAFVMFRLDTSPDVAFQRVREKISTFALPKGVELPQLFKIDKEAAPVLTMRLSSAQHSNAQLSQFIQNRLLPKLEQIPGIGSVYTTGAQFPLIQISLLRSKLSSFFLSADNIKQQVEEQLMRSPAGKLSNPIEQHPISFDSLPTKIEQLNNLPIKLKYNNEHIRLTNIANIEDTLTEKTSYVEFNGKPTLTLSITKQPNGNMVAISEQTQKVIGEIKKNLPTDIELSIVNDDSNYIKESIKAVQFDLIFGILLAVLIVFVFLKSWQHTLITALSIPISLIGSSAFIYWFDFSFNWMTLIALNLSVGILIDDAIVVIENIFRHQAMGKTAQESASQGTKEIGFAAFSITLTLVAVFIPVAFMQGTSGKYFYEFAVTVTVAVIISLFVAFTLTPMLASKLNKNQSHNKANPFLLLFDRFFEKIKANYIKYLSLSLKNPNKTMLVGIVVFILSLCLFKIMPVSPLVTDDSKVSFQFNLAPASSIEKSISRGQEMAKTLGQIPGVIHVIMAIGENGKKVNSITFTLDLVEPAKRKYSAQQLQNLIYQELKKFIQHPDEGFKTSENAAPIKVVIAGENLNEINNYSDEILEFMKKLDDVPLAYLGNEQKNFEYKIIPDLVKINDLNMSPASLAENIKILFQGVNIGKFDNNGQDVEINLKLANYETENIQDLTGITLFNQDNTPIPLGALAKIEKAHMYDKIKHVNAQRRASISAQYTGKNLQKTLSIIEEHIKKTLPLGLTYSFQGASGDLEETSREMMRTILLAIVFVFMILCIQFENFIAPLSVLLSIPLCFSGAFIALLLSREPLTMFAMIGLVMLIGLVTKNAILFVEFVMQDIKKAPTLHESVLRAGNIRFRPIVMTTVTMICGMLPMLFDRSAGWEARFNIALTMIGGLMSSSLLTLFIVPCGLTILYSLKKFFVTLNQRRGTF
ncbi:MAG: efflux RND transporter permease subunit [Silvanigrellaceae bacterium]|nr:efflux RND transporter permease subunit [Silvanigrellaceae bacterium]